jgi:beta-xylosidase
MGLGVNAQFSASDTNTLAAAIDGVGFRFARLDMLWNLVEQVKGQYDFSLYESIISTLAARGIRPLCILDYNNPLYDNTHSPPFTEVRPHTNQARQAFARFAAAAAAKFKSNGIVWEIWNEPDNPRFWYPKPDPDGYMELTNAAVNAMRQADSGATIVGPALVGLEPRYPDARNFLERCFALGLAELVDAISVHSYRLGPPESVTSDYLRLRNLITQYAPSAKANLPIICSEWGYSLTWVSEEQQAEYFARLYLINLMNNLPLTIWYNWHDGPDPKQIEDNFGLVTFHDQPKMVYFAAQTLMQELTTFRFTERVSLPSPADYAFLFTNGTASKHVLWTTGNLHTVTLPISGTSVMVTKLTGEKQTLPIKNGQLTLELSSSPQYLDA